MHLQPTTKPPLCIAGSIGKFGSQWNKCSIVNMCHCLCLSTRFWYLVGFCTALFIYEIQTSCFVYFIAKYCFGPVYDTFIFFKSCVDLLKFPRCSFTCAVQLIYVRTRVSLCVCGFLGNIWRGVFLCQCARLSKVIIEVWLMKSFEFSCHAGRIVHQAVSWMWHSENCCAERDLVSRPHRLYRKQISLQDVSKIVSSTMIKSTIPLCP